MTTVREPAGVPDWTLGWRLQRALSYAEIKVEDIASDLGVGRSTVSRWLNDRGPVRDIYLKQWALRTGVNYEWLKTGAVPTSGHPGGGAESRCIEPWGEVSHLYAVATAQVLPFETAA